MRVHEYGESIGLSSENVLSAVQEINSKVDDTRAITATTAASGLDEREQVMLNHYFQHPPDVGKSEDKSGVTSVENTVNAAFGLTDEPLESDPLAEADAVNEAFADVTGHSMTKEVPQRLYALWGRKLHGKGPAEVKLTQIANDESEAVNLVCKKAKVHPSDYKFNTIKIEDRPEKVVKGTPLKNLDKKPVAV